MSARNFLLALLCGTTFGTGLALSSMTNPERVLGFLDVTGDWDPTLAFVMVGALLVTTPTFQWMARRRRTLDGDEVSLPSSKGIDASLLVGAILFGIGWGLVGLCPGPALAALAIAPREVVLFTAALVVGALLHDKVFAPLREISDAQE